MRSSIPTLKKGDNNYFSVEKIQKKVVFSERKDGTIMVHMFLREKNAIPLTNDLFTDENITIFKEKSLWVSPQGNFGFRRLVSAREIIGIAIEGKFELRLIYNEFVPLLDSQYRVIADKVATSRRYIVEEQLEEIRRYGSYNVEFEMGKYYFLRAINVDDIVFEFRIYKLQTLERILKILRFEIDSYILSNSRVYFRCKVSKSNSSSYYSLYEVYFPNYEVEEKLAYLSYAHKPLLIEDSRNVLDIIVKTTQKKAYGVLTFSDNSNKLLVGVTDPLEEDNIFIGIYLSQIYKEVEQKKQDSDEYIPV